MPLFAEVLALAIPWLNPFAVGPTPALVPLLSSWACLAVCAGLWTRATTPDGSLRAAEVAAPVWYGAAFVSVLMGLLQYSSHAAAFAPWISPAQLGEAYGNLRQRNQFASLTNMGLASVLWWSATPPKSRLLRDLPPELREGLAFAMGALLVVGNAASSSRTGLLQLLLLLATAFVMKPRGTSWSQFPACRILLGCLAVYAAATVLLPLLAGLDPNTTGILARIKSSDAACQSRLTLWGNVLHLITLKPWFGWGWGELDYAHFTTLYPGARFCDILDNAHNLPLHLAVELGVPFAAFACGLVGWLVVRQKPWRETNPARQLAWSVLALIGLHSLLEYPLWYGPFQMAVLLCVFMLWQTPMGAHDVPVTRVIASKIRYATALAAALLLAGCAYAAWDYWRISQIYIAPADRAETYREGTLQKIQGSWLFQSQVRFAELTTTPLTRENALHIHTLALEMLHFSPEPAVARKAIESAQMLGLNDVAAFYTQRFKAAFPDQRIQD